LPAIYRSKLAVGIRPFVPDADPVIGEVPDIGVAAQKPEQFVDDAANMQLFGGHERKALRQVEPELIAENALRSGTRPVGPDHAPVEDMLQELQIGLHAARY